MRHCPFCTTELKVKAQTVAECPQCHAKWQVSFAGAQKHAWAELDSFFGTAEHHDVSALALHPLGTKVCRVCGEIYPEDYSCCPELVKLAIAILCAAPDKLGPNTDTQVLEFLAGHKAVLAHYLAHIAKSGTAAERAAVQQSNLIAALGLADLATVANPKK